MTEFRSAYHNDYHGADVLQTTHCLLTKSNLMNIFSHIEIAALVNRPDIFILFIPLPCFLIQLFAAVVHDYEHPGFNNGYLVKIKSDLALIYNDFSVLGMESSQHTLSLSLCLKIDFFD